MLPDSTALDNLKALLRETVRVSIQDGRIFIGAFFGTDKPLNIILVDAEEYRVGPGENAEGRYVGQIMIPWRLVVKVEAMGPPEPKHVDRDMYI
ncbi:hypothetical protein C8J56DRAFT_850342, partial [Mycena floridula]